MYIKLYYIRCVAEDEIMRRWIALRVDQISNGGDRESSEVIRGGKGGGGRKKKSDFFILVDFRAESIVWPATRISSWKILL